MNSRKIRLYAFLFTACVAGYLWVFWNLNTVKTPEDSMVVCPTKHITGIPCPACGSTRAVVSLVQGDLANAFFTNPFGYLIAIVLLVVPPWICYDLIRKRSTLFLTYRKFENVVSRPQLALPLIALVIVNWVWNIIKGI